MRVTESNSAKPTPKAVKAAKDCNGTRGLVTRETKPAIVVMPASRTAAETFLRADIITSRCFSFVISSFDRDRAS